MESRVARRKSTRYIFSFQYLCFINNYGKGAAAFEAMRLWEEQHPGDKQQLSKEILAAIVGAEVDKLFETHGLDLLDREKAKLHVILRI